MHSTDLPHAGQGRPAIASVRCRRVRGQISGGVLGAADAAYDDARKVWNGIVDRRPALIARCLTDGDVQAAVRFAGEHRMLLSVRGGGHHIAGNAVAEGGLMLDLSGMRSVASTPPSAPRGSARARCSATSIARRRPTAWPRRSASIRPPASPGSRSAAASAG